MPGPQAFSPNANQQNSQLYVYSGAYDPRVVLVPALRGSLFVQIDNGVAGQILLFRKLDNNPTSLNWEPYNISPGADLMQTDFSNAVASANPINLGANLINNVADPVGAQDAATKNYVDNSTLFGTEFQSVSDENEITTTINAYQTVLTLTTPVLPLGNYLFQYYHQLPFNSANVESQLLGNGIPFTDARKAGSRSVIVGGYAYFPGLAGVNTFETQFQRVAGSGIARISRIRMALWRVS